MSIQSHFVREDRVYDVPDCPIAPSSRKRKEKACASCPWNVLHPGRPHTGCFVFVDYDDYRDAMDKLALAAPRDFNRLVEILALLRDRVRGEGLTGPEADLLLPIAERWCERTGEHGPEARVAGSVLPFVRSQVQTGEVVRILT